MTFQFSLWDKFKELANLSNRSFSNLVQMVTHLLHRRSLSLSILKVIFGKVHLTALCSVYVLMSFVLFMNHLHIS